MDCQTPWSHTLWEWPWNVRPHGHMHSVNDLGLSGPMITHLVNDLGLSGPIITHNDLGLSKPRSHAPREWHCTVKATVTRILRMTLDFSKPQLHAPREWSCIVKATVTRILRMTLDCQTHCHTHCVNDLGMSPGSHTLCEWPNFNFYLMINSM